MKRFPILRLTIPLATGIFFAEYFRCDFPLVGTIGVLFALLVLLGGCFFLRKYESRWVFGVGVTLFMFLAGYALMEAKWKQVAMEWPSEKVMYRGVVQDIPVEKRRSIQYKIQVNGRDVLLYLSKDSLSRSVKIGDILIFHALIGKPVYQGNSMGFDYADYLLHQGISGTTYVAPHCWKKENKPTKLTLKQKALVIREKIVSIYRKWGMSDDGEAILSALTVGYTLNFDKGLKDNYSIAGISHVLALSGLHVGILWMFLGGVLSPLKRFRGMRWMRWIMATCLLWVFAFIAGLEASVVRATIMCMLMGLGRLTCGQTLSMNTLGIAAFFMLLYNPFYLFEVGFQLSFVAVISIVLFYPLFAHLLRTDNRVLRWGWNIVSVSLSAQLGTAPLVIYYFSNFSVYFLLANIVAAILVPWIVGLGFFSLLLTPFQMLVGKTVLVLGKLIDCLNLAAFEISEWPYAQLTLTHFSVLELGTVYMLLFCLWRYWSMPTRKGFIGILAAVVSVLVAYLLG